jgi:peptidoglycan/LPS O-acetylase OafA/YrhL
MIIFPVIATVFAFSCAATLVYDYVRRPKPDKITWALAFSIFGAAALCEVIGGLSGWNPFLVRSFYVLGATLVVGYLAVGQLYLILPRRWADRAAGGMVVLSALAVALVQRSPIDGEIEAEGWEALQPTAGLTVITIGINTLGTLVLVGGCLCAVIRFRRRGIMRNRTIGLTLIALGTLTVASGGTLTRLGSRQYLYVAMSAGIALIFTGYLRARRPDGERAIGWRTRIAMLDTLAKNRSITCQGRRRNRPYRRTRRKGSLDPPEVDLGAEPSSERRDQTRAVLHVGQAGEFAR